MFHVHTLIRTNYRKRFYFGPRKGGRRKDQGEASRSFSPNANNSQIIIKMVMNLLLASHAMWRKFSFSAFALLIYSALCRNGAGDSFVDDVSKASLKQLFAHKSCRNFSAILSTYFDKQKTKPLHKNMKLIRVIFSLSWLNKEARLSCFSSDGVETAPAKSNWAGSSK